MGWGKGFFLTQLKQPNLRKLWMLIINMSLSQIMTKLDVWWYREICLLPWEMKNYNQSSPEATQHQNYLIQNLSLENNNLHLEQTLRDRWSNHNQSSAVSSCLLDSSSSPEMMIMVKLGRSHKVPCNQGSYIDRMVIVEGHCTMARSSSLGANCSLVDTKV